ncbi:hypothetical protein T484DRAFT_1754205 [Baffinella frigidus]|nr:hypothetical protein T484DRAFT_1754205 [Cryptophyta sp. CCMP2293]
MQGDAGLFTKNMQTQKSKLCGKVQTAIMYSVLSKTMVTINKVYHPLDIIMVATTINLVCTVVRNCILQDQNTRREFHAGYVLQCLSRHSVLVISDCVSTSVHMRDVGTQPENMLLLLVSTTALISLVSLLPTWFLQDTHNGYSLRPLILYSFMRQYSQMHIPGMHTSGTGFGLLLSGLSFVVANMLGVGGSQDQGSTFMQSMRQVAVMLSCNLFITQIIPDSTTQVLPLAFLLGGYVTMSTTAMSANAASFVLYSTAREVSQWVVRLLPGVITDQLLLFSVSLCVLTPLNPNIATVLAVAALQTSVSYIMNTFASLGGGGATVASLSVLLVTDIVLDIPRK